MKHLCLIPWVHGRLSPNADFSICCYAQPQDERPLGSDSVDAARNRQAFRQMRVNMLRDEPSPACSQCYKMESLGSMSPRVRANRFFADEVSVVKETLPDGSVRTGLRSLDLSLSNVCNLKCRSCSPRSSSSWFAESRALRWTDPTEIQHLCEARPDLKEWLHSVLPDIKLLYFAGGEPLLHASHYELLDTILNMGRTDLILDYNSNLTALRCGGREII